ncbi:MAG: LLM class flavin-dependent oxidoreductase [Chloroflexota bacterium]
MSESIPARRRPLKVGLFLPMNEGQHDGKDPRWADFLAMAQMAEAVGFDSVWLPDHLINKADPANPRGPWECWSVLSALAAATKRVELGTAVICTGFRGPSLLAKMAETVDEISGGRLILGMGAGYHEPEYQAFGVPYDHRASRFEEALTIIHTLLRKGEIDFEGTYYSARECELRPRGPRAGEIPILIGTRGERMLRLTAKYADMWNAWLVFGKSRADQVRPLRDMVDAACRDVGRNPATLERNIGVLVSPVGRTGQPLGAARIVEGVEALTGSPAEIAEGLRAFAGEGVAHVQVYLNPSTTAGVEAFAPVLAELDRG